MDPLDFQRMLLGDHSWIFLLEIILRTFLIYIYAFGLLRLIGRRTVGQLSLVEILVIVALGSAVGDVMFYPEVPLLHAMAVVTAVVLLTALINRLVASMEAVETVIEGSPKQVLKNGVLDRDGMVAASLPAEEMFEQLRLRGVSNLSQLRAAYVEQNGELSIFFARPELQSFGLAIEPPHDLQPPECFDADSTTDGEEVYACLRDGRLRAAQAGEVLGNCECGGETWTIATEAESHQEDQAPRRRRPGNRL